MCGRYTLILEGSVIADWFDIDLSGLELEPRYNIAPTSQVLTVAREGDRDQARMMRWGLVPWFTRELSSRYSMINARAESLTERNSYKQAFQRRRCLIPADSFYEWKKGPGRSKQPMRVMLKSEEPFAFAGIWDRWTPPGQEKAGAILSCSIITTVANSLVAPIHDRMPVILPRELYGDWMDPANKDTGALREMLLPYDPEPMKAYPVSALVNSVANTGPEVIAPASDYQLL